MMPVVTAVSVCSTCAVPVMVGAPVAGVFAGTLRYSVRIVRPDQSRPELDHVYVIYEEL